MTASSTSILQRLCPGGLLAVAALLAWTGGAQAAHGLEELEGLLAQPVYAASKYAQASADAPVAMTVLTASDIQTYGWRTLAEVLNAVRGVLLREDRAYSNIGVRGFGRPSDLSQRVLITIDGMRINDAIYDQALPGREFPLEVGLIDRVEFIPGPGSAFYGSNAVVAVVNVVTRSAGSLGGGNVSLGIGSLNARSVSLRQGLALESGSLVLGAHAERRPGGALYYPEFDDGTGLKGVASGLDGETDRKLFAKWQQGEWQAMTLWSDRVKDVPTAYYGIDFGVLAPITDRYAAADLQWRRAGQVYDLQARVSLLDYRFQGNYPYGEDTYVDSASARWWLTEASLVYRGWNGHRIVVGGELQHNSSQRQTSEVVGANPQTVLDIARSSQRFGVYLSDEWSITPHWRLVLGARWDHHTDGDDSLTPRLALVWQPSPGLSLKWVDGQAYREPSFYEANYADGTSQIANTALQVESMRAQELVLDWQPGEGLRLAGSVFRNRFTDMIDQGVDPVSGLLQFQNTAGVRSRGVEAEADYVSSGGWRLRGSWAGLETEDNSSGQALVNAPRSLTKLHASLPLGWQGAVLGLEWLRVGQRLTLAGAALPSHQVVGATLRLAPAGARWSLSAGLSNALDTAYADPGGPEHVQDSLARDGRQWRLAYSLAF